MQEDNTPQIILSLDKTQAETLKACIMLTSKQVGLDDGGASQVRLLSLNSELLKAIEDYTIRTQTTNDD